MPSRNTIKEDVAESYYHIYARGNNKQTIFLDAKDFIYFEELLARYLSKEPRASKEGLQYPHYYEKIELLAYCLMGNHFHLLVYQSELGTMTKLMRSLMTSYSVYFNLKYKRSGRLFESRYRASRIDNQGYLEHISRYIHLNPRYWRQYAYSSYKFYDSGECPEWLLPEKVTSMFPVAGEYKKFVEDYEGHKAMLKEIKSELAN